MIQVYGIKNCGSVKKAITFLKDRNLEFTFIDFKLQKPSVLELESWLKVVDINVLLNKKGTTYKKLGLKAMDLDEKEIKEWLLKEPLLIKRPVIMYKNNVIVGFDIEKYMEIFA